MTAFKKNDYTKKEINAMPFLVSRLYYEYQMGFESDSVLVNEAAIKYPQYFNDNE